MGTPLRVAGSKLSRSIQAEISCLASLDAFPVNRASLVTGRPVSSIGTSTVPWKRGMERTAGPPVDFIFAAITSALDEPSTGEDPDELAHPPPGIKQRRTMTAWISLPRIIDDSNRITRPIFGILPSSQCRFHINELSVS
jgi:hypothetical protein